MDTLKRHLPVSGQEGLHELKKIAIRFEEKIYTAATSQSDYLRKISLKMLTMETKSQNPIASSLPSNAAGSSIKAPDPGLIGMPSQVHSQGQSLPTPLSTSQSQARQQMLSQNIQNSIATAGVQSSASLPSALPPVSGLNQTPMSNVVGQNTNVQNISGISQNSGGNSMGQGVPSNMFANNPRQMPGRQQVGSLLQPQNVIDPQKQLYQRALPETSSTSLDSTAQTHSNGGDWQEEVYQKIKTMKELYLPEINEMYQKIATKLQQHDSLPQQPKSDQLEKLKIFRTMLERIITFLQVSKNNILPNFKEKLGSYEKQILNFINTNRPRKPVSSLQPGQLPPPHMHSMQQPQSQITQMQSHENQMNPQLQSMNLQSSVATLQQNNMTNLQHNSLSSLPGVSMAQQNMINSLQPGSNLDSGQGNGLSSLQQVAMGSLQQNPVNAAQQANVNTLSSQSGLGVKTGVFQPHLQANQRSAYSHQQLKPGASFPISSPQLLQAASPQMPQHSSPQVDQQNASSLTKAGTPLQSVNSPFVVPSPSTPLAPSPMPGDSEKPITGVSPLSNVGNIGHQQTSGVAAQAPSLAIGTPGISASPLLAEFTGPDGNHGNVLMNGPPKSSSTEQPLDRLIKVVKSISPKALSASVSDIGSVVSMIDRIAGSAPSNGSRGAVGEDLVAMTKCRLQARNFITQDVTNGTRKMRRYTSAMPLNVVSSAGSMNDSFKQVTGSETSDLESTATSSIKRPRIEVNHALLEEIRDINQGLIDTIVDISDEDVDPTAAAAEGGEGTIVKCSFSAVALSPNLKSQYASAQMSPIQPLRLLVPSNYPNCSPILLDKFPVEVSKEYEDLSVKAKSRFSISLRSLSQPMSLGQIARTWDVCARAVISEHAQQSGGGSFSSKYGTWEDCMSAA
ncbi:hypothetical protein FH972_001928 [Carpinus fangiana]|uniref:Uncharacterized protein n=1 Tax=Carpinus fangiana TaxID=176857 RepID=A0A5N6QFN8_9ROSI|nr:hypothetical protein FH972_001928 [Carpinus fangiana]